MQRFTYLTEKGNTYTVTVTKDKVHMNMVISFFYSRSISKMKNTTFMTEEKYKSMISLENGKEL